MLCQELEYFGPGTFQQQLDQAYKDFQTFCRANKLDQSQPPFKESKVPGYVIETCFFQSSQTYRLFSWLDQAVVGGSVVPQMCYQVNLRMLEWTIYCIEWEVLFYDIPSPVVCSSFLRWCSMTSIHWMQKHGTVVLSAVGWQKFCPELLNSFRMDMMRVGLCWPVMRWTFATHSASVCFAFSKKWESVK